MTDREVVVTGGTGFVGRALVARLEADGRSFARVGRQNDPQGGGPGRWIHADLAASGSSELAAALAGSGAVVHLAAVTGRARPDAYERVNVDGTQRLLDAAKEAGVERFVYVSTIATRYPELDHYPYARSKAEAERRVQASGLAWTILRPTIILGEASPIQASLSGLARLLVTPRFGSGRVKVQPIDVRDVVSCVVDSLEDASVLGQAIDLGGPDQLTFSDFLRRLRKSVGRSPGALLPIPLAPTMLGLSLAEPWFHGVLPVTAGQLYAFRYDSTAEPSPFLQDRIAGFSTLDAILERTAGAG